MEDLRGNPGVSVNYLAVSVGAGVATGEAEHGGRLLVALKVVLDEGGGVRADTLSETVVDRVQLGDARDTVLLGYREDGHIRDWSQITGRVGLQSRRGEQVKF